MSSRLQGQGSEYTEMFDKQKIGNNNPFRIGSFAPLEQRDMDLTFGIVASKDFC